ncbi:hypothetical protein [Nocardia sp. NPDC050710]|uniref:hypothetical protein n=1 Tax=Nocardia sp. NPDC050710 TaxID=3157220 RepID=UPI0034042391
MTVSFMVLTFHGMPPGMPGSEGAIALMPEVLFTVAAEADPVLSRGPGHEKSATFPQVQASHQQTGSGLFLPQIAGGLEGPLHHHRADAVRASSKPVFGVGILEVRHTNYETEVNRRCATPSLAGPVERPPGTAAEPTSTRSARPYRTTSGARDMMVKLTRTVAENPCPADRWSGKRSRGEFLGGRVVIQVRERRDAGR